MPAKKNTATRPPATVSGKRLVSFEEAFADVVDEIDEELEKESFVATIQSMMEKQKVSEAALAKRMATSRSAVRSLLDVREGATVASMAKAARALGARVRISVETPAPAPKRARRKAQTTAPGGRRETR